MVTCSDVLWAGSKTALSPAGPGKKARWELPWADAELDSSLCSTWDAGDFRAGWWQVVVAGAGHMVSLHPDLQGAWKMRAQKTSDTEHGKQPPLPAALLQPLSVRHVHL